MIKVVGLGMLGLLAVTVQANASVITGVTATASSELTSAPFDRAAAYAVNGAGLQPGNAFANTPDATMWLTSVNDAASSITFNLGADYSLTGMQVWNYNENGLTGRGIQSAAISTSIDGVTYVPAVNITLSQAPGTTNVDFAQVVALSGSAEFVRFANLQSYSNDGYIGLSQVEFSAGPLLNVASDVPEPISLGLLGIACASMIAFRRRDLTIG